MRHFDAAAYVGDAGGPLIGKLPDYQSGHKRQSLNDGNRSIEVRLAPCLLTPGSIHFGQTKFTGSSF